jgi:hypothetical protein
VKKHSAIDAKSGGRLGKTMAENRALLAMTACLKNYLLNEFDIPPQEDAPTLA